jgi:hypothetical protein
LASGRFLDSRCVSQLPRNSLDEVHTIGDDMVIAAHDRIAAGAGRAVKEPSRGQASSNEHV